MHSERYKMAVVKRLLRPNTKITHLAKKLKIRTDSLRDWKKKYINRFESMLNKNRNYHYKVQLLYLKSKLSFYRRNYKKALYFINRSLLLHKSLSDNLSLLSNNRVKLQLIEQKIIILLKTGNLNKTVESIKVMEDMIKEIEYHKKQGASVVILSAALCYICKPLSKHLGTNDVICSEMEVKQGIFTGKPKGEICIGKEKEIKAREYCVEKSYNLW